MEKNDFIAKLPVFFGTVVGGLTLLLIVFSFGSGLLKNFGQPAEFYVQQPGPDGIPCQTGIKSLIPDFKCGVNCYYRVNYVCADNFKGQLDVSQIITPIKQGSTCRNLSYWRNLVKPICEKHPYCPSPRPSYSPKPSYSPSPKPSEKL